MNEAALASQAMFEAMFDHVPRVDLTRPPGKPSPTAAERAALRKDAPMAKMERDVAGLISAELRPPKRLDS